MVDWAFVNSSTINRIGYNKDVQTLYIDFVGSEVDTAFIKVPEVLFKTFIDSKSPGQFFKQFVEGYFEVVNFHLENYIDSNHQDSIIDSSS